MNGYDRQSITYSFDIITPAYTYGSNNELELRATAIKGILRFWWRFLNWSANYEILFKNESEIFGSTNNQSQIAIYINEKELIRRSANRQSYFDINSKFDLIISFPEKYRETIVRVLRLFITFGGIGGKRHLGYGALHCKELKYIESNELNIFNINPKHVYEKTYKVSNVNQILQTIYTSYKKAKPRNVTRIKPFFIGINKQNDCFICKVLYNDRVRRHFNDNFERFYWDFIENLKR